MDVTELILSAMENTLGLDAQEMRRNLTLDLFESALVDSLAIVSLIAEIEACTGRRISIAGIDPQSLHTISGLAAAVARQIN